VFVECNANIALAARKLGVSRNTVYAHTRVSVDEG
jgi:transcriptional regulator of acetoin/glycerol metabolism